MSGFECLRCGSCCRVAGEALHITQSDVERWLVEGRDDILDEVFPVRVFCKECNVQWPSPAGENCPKCGQRGEPIWYWIDHGRGQSYMGQLLGAPRCPFLRKIRKKEEYSCLIHETRPEVCREFPKLDSDKVTKNEEECVEWRCKGYLDWKEKSRR